MTQSSLHGRVILGMILVAACWTFAGCSSLFDSTHVCRQEDAASAHIAVISVAPWDAYRDAVQPNFKLSSDDAFALSLPNTLALEQKVVDALGLTAKVALPGTSMSETKTLHSETGKPTIETHDLAQTNSSGDASKLTFSPSPAGTRTAAGLPPSTSVLGVPLGTDPMLKFLAADALYQEVQIINRYVKDAAVFENFLPYLVRFEVSLMPRRRNLSYDAYTLISFFHGPWLEPREPASKSEVQVLPMLVTDDLESLMESRSIDQVRQIAFALAAAVHGVGVSGDIQKLNETLRTALGRVFNSTFMVARVSDNTIQCRFGAAYQAESKYAMIPQTHKVSLLVLVPREKAAVPERDERTIRVVAKTTLTDPISGATLKEQTRSEEQAELIKLLERRGVANQIASSDAYDLRKYMAANNFYDFKEKLLQMNPNITYPEAIWVEVTSIRNRHSVSSATFTVPQQDPGLIKDRIELAGHVPTLQDDGKGMSATLLLLRGLNLTSSQLGAFLTITPKRSGKPALTFAADSIGIAGGGNQINFSFPSISPYKLTDTNGILDADAKLTLYTSGRNSTNLLAGANCSYILKPDAAKAGFTISTRSKFINTDGTNAGSCQVLFTEKKPDAKIRFIVQGAELNTVQSASDGLTVQPDVDGWIVSTNGTVKLLLGNLSSISPVVISATDTSNKAASPQIVLPVIPPQGARLVLPTQ